MILVDTSVWVDHLRATEAALAELLDRGQVLAHPFVVGEIALGVLRNPDVVLSELQALPQATLATPTEVLLFINTNALHGLGIGYVDAHLLASARLSDATLWSRDKRLAEVAEKMGLKAKGLR